MEIETYNQQLPPDPALGLHGVSGSNVIREHCEFKDAPCNYTGRGWYDRCAWCNDNNSFIRKSNDSSKPF